MKYSREGVISYILPALSVQYPHLTAIYPLTYEISLSYTLAGDPVQLAYQPGSGMGPAIQRR